MQRVKNRRKVTLKTQLGCQGWKGERVGVNCGILGERALILEGDMYVVYHLHGKTGRSTVWVNGTQNLGQINFVPESRLRFVQISSINYQKTAAKA